MTLTGIAPQYCAGALLVKYDSTGAAQWAKTLAAETDSSSFTGITADTSGNLFAVGGIDANVSYNFGNGVIAQGTNLTGYNAVLVKYNSSGIAQ